MEKLTFNLNQKRWILNKSEESSTPVQVHHFHALLEMFKSGDFFYLLFIPERNATTFCSNGFRDILDIDVETVKMEQLFDLIHPDDRTIVEEFEAEAQEFYRSLPSKERWNYKTRYNFRIRTKYGRFKHVLFQSVPYQLTEGKEIEYIGIFTNINSIKSDSDQHLSFIHLKGGVSHRPYKTIRKAESLPPLSVREVEILKCVMKEYDLSNTSQKLNISLNTLRNHLKHIRNKTGAKSTIHLVALAKERHWIK